MRTRNGKFYERVVDLISSGRKDFRSFQTLALLVNHEIKDAHDFFNLWGTKGEDITTDFLLIARTLSREDIIAEFEREYSETSPQNTITQEEKEMKVKI